MKEYKIKYLNEIPAFNTVENEPKGLPGFGKDSQNYVTGVHILAQKSATMVRFQNT